MDLRVEVSPKAAEDISDVCAWLKKESSFDAAESWYFGIMEAIRALANLPARCPLSVEGKELKREIRQQLYGNRRAAYRVLFQVLEAKNVSYVRILRVQHNVRRHLRFEELSVD